MPKIIMSAPLLYEQLQRHLPKNIDHRLQASRSFKPLPGFIAEYLEKFFATQELPRKQER